MASKLCFLSVFWLNFFVVFCAGRKKALNLKQDDLVLKYSKFVIPIEEYVFEPAHKVPIVMTRAPEVILDLPAYSSLKKSKLRKLGRNFDSKQVTCSPQAELAKMLKESRCKPRPILIDLLPINGSRVYPNKLVVRRCGGLCSAITTCRATSSKNSTFVVRTFTSSTSKCVQLSIPEDQKCSCSCTITKADCSIKQIYNKTNCSCGCSKDAIVNCTKRSNTKFNETSCTCNCAKTKACTTGSTWNPKTCRCEMVSVIKMKPK